MPWKNHCFLYVIIFNSIDIKVVPPPPIIFIFLFIVLDILFGYYQIGHGSVKILKKKFVTMTLTLTSFSAKNGQKRGQNANFSNILVWNPWKIFAKSLFYMKVHSLILILFYELFSISIAYWMATILRKVAIFGIFPQKMTIDLDLGVTQVHRS